MKESLKLRAVLSSKFVVFTKLCLKSRSDTILVTKGIGTHIGYQGGSLPQVSHDSLDLEAFNFFVSNKFILNCLKKGKVDQISFVLSPW